MIEEIHTTTITAFGYEHTFTDTNEVDEAAILGARYIYLLCGSDEAIDNFHGCLKKPFRDLYWSNVDEALIFSDDHLKMPDLTFAKVLGIVVHEQEA